MALTPTQIELHLARQQRLERFAAAAARHQASRPQPPAPLSAPLLAAPSPPAVSRRIIIAAPSIVPATRTLPRATKPVRQIQTVVCETFGISLIDMLSERRSRSVACARMAAFYLCRELTTQSWPELGRQFGRHHTTILIGASRFRDRMTADSNLAAQVAAARRILQENDDGAPLQAGHDRS